MSTARIGSLICLFAVVLGAFGAHGLKAIIEEHQGQDWWDKAVLYHFVHGLAILFTASSTSTPQTPGISTTTILFLVGIIIFSGSLYAMALTGIRSLGMVTPVGGLLFIAGWLLMAYEAQSD